MARLFELLKSFWGRSMLHRALMVAPPVALLLWLAVVMLGTRSTAQYFTAKVEHGDISQVVQATGTINPVNTVPVGSVVSGNVVSVSVDFNSQVKKGDILAMIDPVPFQLALSQAEAGYQNSQANLNNLEAQIGTAQANVSTMKANVAKAHATMIDMGTQQQRTKLLAAQGVLSAQQNDDAQANYDEAVATENAVPQHIRIRDLPGGFGGRLLHSLLELVPVLRLGDDQVFDDIGNVPGAGGRAELELLRRQRGGHFDQPRFGQLEMSDEARAFQFRHRAGVDARHK